MFYFGHLLKTQLIFTHTHLKDLTNKDFILQKLKASIEGRCLQELGYLIQVLPMRDAQKQKGAILSAIEVTEQGCVAKIQFDCLCFKPHKGDIIDICVYSINSEMIRGKLGAAEVMIPKQRMGCLTYNECQNAYFSEQESGDSWSVRVDSVLRCRCLQWVVQQDNIMKIIGEVDQYLIFSLLQRRIE